MCRLRIEPMRVRIDAELAQLLEIGAPLNDLIGFFGGGHSRSKRRRIASRMPLMNRTESSLLKVRASSSASLMMTRAGVSGFVKKLVHGQAQDQTVQDVHALDPPVLGRFGNHRVDVADRVDHAGGQLRAKARWSSDSDVACESSCIQNVDSTSSSEQRPTSH